MSTIFAFSAIAQLNPLRVKWVQEGNSTSRPQTFTSHFEFTNISSQPIEPGWEFCFNTFARGLRAADDAPMNAQVIKNANYWRLTTNERYKPLLPGETCVVKLIHQGSFSHIIYAPDGGHIVLQNKQTIPVDIEVAPLTRPEQFSITERPDYTWGDYCYNFNQIIIGNATAIKANPYDIFPTPKKVSLSKGEVAIPQTVMMALDAEINKAMPGAAKYIASRLQRKGIAVEANADFTITAMVNAKLHQNPEYYELTVKPGRLAVVGSTPAGALNGLKTLATVIERSNMTLPQAKVIDYPDLNYRGFMIDLARNFIGFKDQLKLIDRLAEYKVNVVQYHFNDDEGWRLEIPAIPELTEVGARRGYTLDETHDGFLMQTYSGSGNPDDIVGSSNGHLTADQFVELLRYANDRGIRIIPEIETPGHARAAIVAMKTRYNRLLKTDPQKAIEYQLWDPDDTSVYDSAQGFRDNVLCVALPGVYKFVTKVATELQSLYTKAGLTLTAIHLGGDEVPGKCWDKSPLIQKLKAQEGLKTDHDVAAYYMQRITREFEKVGLKIAGWQEIATHKTDDYAAKVAPRVEAITVWSTLGKKDSIAYDLANKGYKVVLSNVNNFYLDLIYDAHQYERGLTWGGKCNEFISFNNQPYHNYYSARETWTGAPIDLATAPNGKTPLLRPENIVGVQSQLWSETLRNYNMVEYYIFPKLFGMAERGWNANPDWGGKNTLNIALYNKAIAAYSQKIANAELPHLNAIGANFHLAQPGLIVEGGMLKANSLYPQGVIRYTLDGTEPTAQSPIYTQPVPCAEPQKARAAVFYLNHRSIASQIRP